VPDEPNAFEKIISLFAERLRVAPGAARLTRLAKTAKRTPEALLADLTPLVLQLDDVQFVGDDIALHLIDVGYCDARYTDAVHFVSTLKARLQRYIDNPGAANNARGDFREHVAWWRMALGRAAEPCRWPAIVLMEIASGV
jgi:hypothetical protein